MRILINRQIASPFSNTLRCLFKILLSLNDWGISSRVSESLIILRAGKFVRSMFRSTTARGIFGWFDAAFNKYDSERVKEVYYNGWWSRVLVLFRTVIVRSVLTGPPQSGYCDAEEGWRITMDTVFETTTASQWVNIGELLSFPITPLRGIWDVTTFN